MEYLTTHLSLLSFCKPNVVSSIVVLKKNLDITIKNFIDNSKSKKLDSRYHCVVIP